MRVAVACSCWVCASFSLMLLTFHFKEESTPVLQRSTTSCSTFLPTLGTGTKGKSVTRKCPKCCVYNHLTTWLHPHFFTRKIHVKNIQYNESIKTLALLYLVRNSSSTSVFVLCFNQCWRLCLLYNLWSSHANELTNGIIFLLLFVRYIPSRCFLWLLKDTNKIPRFL